MKTLPFFLFSGSVILFNSYASVVHDRLATGTVVRDCTGTYLRFGEKDDYQVCNANMLEKVTAGQQVSVIYDFTKKCPESEGKVVCMMYHENKGMIRVKSVK